MKTIFISSFHPLISRNILSTPLIGKLTDEGGMRVVVIAPLKKKSFFEMELAGSDAVLEFVNTRLQLGDKLLRYLSLAALDSRSLKIKRSSKMRTTSAFFGKIAANSLGLRLNRYLSAYFTPRGLFRDLLMKYSPVLIFSTDVQNEFDVRLLIEAKDRGIKTVGAVRSWDNLTCKGIIRIMPDKLVVNNEILKNEAVSMHNVSPDVIEVIGIPHYDFYADQKNRTPREDFFKGLSLNPAKRVLLFAPAGDRYVKENIVDRDIMKIIDKNLDDNWQILVRLPPTDKVSNLENFNAPGRIIFDRPERFFATPKNNEISKSSDRRLADALFYCDAVVSGPSTMAVDAAFFDKPVILAGFDGIGKRPYKKSILRYYDYDHWKQVLESNGAKLCRSPEEFALELDRAISDKTYKSKERKELARGQCQFTDGGSTDRLLGTILKMI
ncbi:hypothetical protein A2W54_02430 [Candidatus Giovannonibacteria bacterium RIFCSPHIGHO2_02_43_13]|uniref:Lipid-A-disaccharide synthase n=1 Tax=Candidatus Giovannonibacteria bacterium RIFCSPHIGHO2_02_43_13 TaxID=1798330 RepID=A0A1F5WUD3_9BACT|nr:MAG: hypothetical protein A2W54_02430 [Candidatus Giovannonibacteria bacterium RIFCSPHIGHO2_02_43_13]